MGWKNKIIAGLKRNPKNLTFRHKSWHHHQLPCFLIVLSYCSFSQRLPLNIESPFFLVLSLSITLGLFQNFLCFGLTGTSNQSALTANQKNTITTLSFKKNFHLDIQWPIFCCNTWQKQNTIAKIIAKSVIYRSPKEKKDDYWSKHRSFQAYNVLLKTSPSYTHLVPLNFVRKMKTQTFI